MNLQLIGIQLAGLGEGHDRARDMRASFAVEGRHTEIFADRIERRLQNFHLTVIETAKDHLHRRLARFKWTGTADLSATGAQAASR